MDRSALLACIKSTLDASSDIRSKSEAELKEVRKMAPVNRITAELSNEQAETRQGFVGILLDVVNQETELQTQLSGRSYCPGGNE